MGRCPSLLGMYIIPKIKAPLWIGRFMPIVYFADILLFLVLIYSFWDK